MKSKFSACVLESVWPRWVVFSVVILAIISSCSLLYLLKCHFWQKSQGEMVDIEEKETVGFPPPTPNSFFLCFIMKSCEQ